MYSHYSAAAEDLRYALRIVDIKRYLLKLDLQSRKFILNSCIDYINSSPHENDAQTVALKQWFADFAIITEDEDANLRKEETKSCARWNALFDLKDSECLSAIAFIIFPMIK